VHHPRRSVFAMINAKERGVSSQTISRTILSAEPGIKRLVGIEVNFGEQQSSRRTG
jgi:hypothetical protein